MFHTEEGNERSVAVAVGALADPTFPPPEVSVYDHRRHGWVELPANIRSFAEDPD